MAETITKVLYPEDNHYEGKSLRLAQQYFLVSASVQDIVRRHLYTHSSLDDLPKLAAIHLNDTHPVLAIPELMRIMLDECGYGWDEAWDITCRTLSYTNHTVMSEALECWSADLFKSRLPRIYQIVEEINRRFWIEMRAKGVDEGKIRRMAPLNDGYVRMANLAVYATHSTNGVSALHSEILKDSVFHDFYTEWPNKFKNVTNGIAHRRWLNQSNPELASLITELTGDGFIHDAAQLEKLMKYKDDTSVQKKLAEIKLHNKQRLAEHVKRTQGQIVDPNSIFDVQVKRLHEYKRQLLNALSIMDLYLSIKDGSIKDFTPTAFIFGAKAAPGYRRAKAIIHYVNRVADLINSDPAMDGIMKVVFVQNYNCSYAEHIIPAADVSEQISPAGTEASGTGNMKLMLNGAVTLGTLDGANVEIAEQAGMENEYIFGATVEEINMVKPNYNARSFYEASPNLRRAVDTLIDGTVPTDEEQHELYTSLLKGASWHKPDQYFIFYDFDSYKKARLRVNHDYCDRIAFGRKCLMNVASAGKFSSDRTIHEYIDKIWHLEPLHGGK